MDTIHTVDTVRMVCASCASYAISTIQTLHAIYSVRSAHNVQGMLSSAQIMKRIVQDSMRVCSAITKRVHANATHTIRRPWGQLGWNPDVPLIERYRRVPFLEMDVRGDETGFKHKHRLDDTSYSSRSFKMANLLNVVKIWQNNLKCQTGERSTNIGLHRSH
jgi:hypothetical protein